MTEKWYEIPESGAEKYIKNLRLKLFPRVEDEKYWFVLLSWYSSLEDGHDEISYMVAFEAARRLNLEIKDVVDVFDKCLVVNNPHDVKSLNIRLDRKFKFLIDLNFSSIRVASFYYERLRTLKRYEVKRDESPYTFESLEIKLGIVGVSFYEVFLALVDVGLISRSSRSSGPDGEIVKYSLAVNVLNDFENWYKNEYIIFFDRWLNPIKSEKLESGNVFFVNQYFHEVQLSSKIEDPFCFIVMPFDDEEHDQHYYFEVIKPFVKETFGINSYRSDDDKKSLKVDDKIYTLIKKSKFVIADVSSKNPNVMYEIGLAHALNKEVILITINQHDEMPFDIKNIHAEKYGNDEMLKTLLKEQISSYGHKSL